MESLGVKLWKEIISSYVDPVQLEIISGGFCSKSITNPYCWTAPSTGWLEDSPEEADTWNNSDVIGERRSRSKNRAERAWLFIIQNGKIWKTQVGGSKQTETMEERAQQRFESRNKSLSTGR